MHVIAWLSAMPWTELANVAPPTSTHTPTHARTHARTHLALQLRRLGVELRKHVLQALHAQAVHEIATAVAVTAAAGRRRGGRRRAAARCRRGTTAATAARLGVAIGGLVLLLLVVDGKQAPQQARAARAEPVDALVGQRRQRRLHAAHVQAQPAGAQIAQQDVVVVLRVGAAALGAGNVVRVDAVVAVVAVAVGRSSSSSSSSGGGGSGGGCGRAAAPCAG